MCAGARSAKVGLLVALLGLRLGRDPVESAACVCPRRADDVAGSPQDRPRRSAAHEERAAEEHSRAHDDRAGSADEPRHGAADREPDEASVVVAAEQRHQAEKAHAEPEPERPDVEEVAPREHERADSHERERERIRRVSEHGAEPVREPGADGAAVEAEVEDRRQHEAERGQPEPEQLALVVRRPPSPRGPLPHA